VLLLRGAARLVGRVVRILAHDSHACHFRAGSSFRGGPSAEGHANGKRLIHGWLAPSEGANSHPGESIQQPALFTLFLRRASCEAANETRSLGWNCRLFNKQIGAELD